MTDPVENPYTKDVTVIIRDDSPMVHCGDAPTYRTVRFELTEEQFAKIVLRKYEDVSRMILEPKEARHA